MADPTDTDTTDVATDPATDPTTGQPKPAGPTITGSDFGQTIVKRTNPDGSVTTITTENTGNRILETQRTDPTTGAVIKSTVNEVDGSQENSTTWPDGRVVTNHSDHAGRTTTEEVAKGSDGSEWRQVTTADGATTVTRTLLDPDGTTRVVTRDPDGKIEVTSTKEVKLEGGKAQTTRVEPDGSTMTITKDTIDETADVILRHPDGTWERTVTSQDPNDPSTKVERTTSSQGTVSKNFWTSRSITQSYFQHRCRHAPTASWADLLGR